LLNNVWLELHVRKVETTGSVERSKAAGQSIQWAQEKTLNQFMNWFSAKKVGRVHIDQCVKS